MNYRNIKSSEDISSGYSSGEALHHQQSYRGTNASEHRLERTASVGARTRSKQQRPVIKKTQEVMFLIHIYSMTTP